jgi:hypothetical protein
MKHHISLPQPFVGKMLTVIATNTSVHRPLICDPRIKAEFQAAARDVLRPQYWMPRLDCKQKGEGRWNSVWKEAVL